MQQNPEIYFVTIIGIILGLLLAGLIITMVFMYKRRQQKQEAEMARIKDAFEKEALRSQLEIQENTLKTISQELHDNIGQMLSVVKLSLSALPISKSHPAYELSSHSQQVLNKAITDLSDLTKSLHSDRISEIGLVDSIRYELATIKNTGLLQVQFNINGREFHLPGQHSIFLFRMFQEILNNILKHAKATIVNVNLDYLPGSLFKMRICDNGIGFDLEKERGTVDSSKGVGLKSIFNRARLIEAQVNIESGKGKGTCIQVELNNRDNEGK